MTTEYINKLVCSFGRLRHYPLSETQDYYWSTSRAYSTKLGQWTTIDPLVAWNPKKLASTFGNWNPYVYCNGDSVNCVDPTGHYTVRAGAGTEVSEVIGFGGEIGIAVSFSMDKGLGLDFYKESEKSIGWQGGLKMDASLKLSNAAHVSMLQGHSAGGKLELAAGFGGGASYSQGLNLNGTFNNIKEIGMNINAGAEVSVSGIHSKTHMYNNQTLKNFADRFNNFFGIGKN